MLPFTGYGFLKNANVPDTDTPLNGATKEQWETCKAAIDPVTNPRGEFDDEGLGLRCYVTGVEV